MCRMHIKTVREIRREEHLMQENSTPGLDFGGFAQWIFNDFPQQWTAPTTDAIPPLPALDFTGIIGDVIQIMGGPPDTWSVNLLPLITAAPQLQPQAIIASHQTQGGSPDLSEQPQINASHQSQGGNHESSQQPQTAVNEFLQAQEVTSVPFMPQEDGGNNQQLQPQVNLGGIIMPPVSFSESSQESQTVNLAPLLPASVIESNGQPQAGTNEPSQQSHNSLLEILPVPTNTSEVLQAGSYDPFYQSQGSGPSQQLVGGIVPLSGWGGVFQHAHYGQGGIPNHTEANSQELSLQPQPGTNGSSQTLHNSMGGMLFPGSLVGFPQQFQSGPNGSSLQPHPVTSPPVGLAGLIPAISAVHQQLLVGMSGISEPSEASNHGSSQAGTIASSQSFEAHMSGPSPSTSLFFLQQLLHSGHTGMSGSSQQPGNTNALFQQSSAGLQQSQAAISETSQQPEESTNENAQDLQTDTNTLSQTNADELSPADVEDL